MIETRDAVVAAPPDVVRIAAALVGAAIVIGALYLGQAVFVPLAISFLIGFALNPLVTWLTRHGLPRVLAVIGVMLAVCTVLVLLAVLIGSQIRGLSAELPTYQSTIRTKIENLADGLRKPSMIDGALETVETVARKVDEESKQGQRSPPAQRVEIVEPPLAPFKSALQWLQPALEPLATAGIVFVFVFLVLLDRGDLRDRLIRLLGGNLHRATDAMQDAGNRISRYLLMQLVVNVTYGIPMALGLWLIGVPGWLLWGTLATLMRFVPYVGPLLSAVFPLALAFAVDPGWNMVLWTLALILALELISNNVVEPLLYGSSTGLSAMSLITAAIFWTALWGPVGLILSTPLTVCLLVVGRNHPHLQFLDILLGSTPVVDVPTRIYQRLIADDPEEAIEIVNDVVADGDIAGFYNDHGIELLRRVSDDFHQAARAEHRLRVANGLDTLLDDIREEWPGTVPPDARERIVCIGGKWEIDSVACEMLVHALALQGIAAGQRREGAITTRHVDRLALDGVDVVCLSFFSRHPEPAAKGFCRRLRARWPQARIVLALWNASPDQLDPAVFRALGADEVVSSVNEAVRRLHRMVEPEVAQLRHLATPPDNDAARVGALRRSGVLSGATREDLDALARRAADVFDVPLALISAIDERHEHVVGQSGELPAPLASDGPGASRPRSEALCDHVVGSGEPLVIGDTQRDPRFADHPAVLHWNTRFYAGAPLLTAEGHVLGALCLLDGTPRTFGDDERQLLAGMAADVVATITGDEVVEPEPLDGEEPSATVGQNVPQ